MKRVLIAYADSACEFSLKRIGKQAKRLGVFNDIILWRPKDLPKYILDSPLMQYPYGGGYWAWKPCIIWETLQQYDDDTIVCYVDAGCTLKSGIEWSLYFQLMEDHEAVLFKYRDEMPIWEKFGSSSTKIKHWTKKTAIEFYDQYLNTNAWQELNKIWGGLLFVKGKNNEFVKSWLHIMLNNPEVIIDPAADEKQNSFFAQHKHDQPALTALSYKYNNICAVLPELSETCGESVAVYASRVRCASLFDYIIWSVKKHLRRIFGERLIHIVKAYIRK